MNREDLESDQLSSLLRKLQEKVIELELRVAQLVKDVEDLKAA